MNERFHQEEFECENVNIILAGSLHVHVYVLQKLSSVSKELKFTHLWAWQSCYNKASHLLPVHVHGAFFSHPKHHAAVPQQGHYHGYQVVILDGGPGLDSGLTVMELLHCAAEGHVCVLGWLSVLHVLLLTLGLSGEVALHIARAEEGHL